MTDVYLNTLLLFIFGTFLGSFLNLVSDRSVKGGKIIIGHSKCDFCGKILRPLNLIPIVSFLWQRGKCSNCKKSLARIYVFSEVVAGMLLVLAAYLSKFSIFGPFDLTSALGFAFLVVVFSFYEILVLTDLKYLLIPDKVVLPAIGFVALFHVITTSVNLWDYRIRLQNDEFGQYLFRLGYFEDQMLDVARSLGTNFASAIVIALLFLFLVWVTRGRGMGGGDIRLALLVGLVNPFPHNLLAIFLAFFTGAIISIMFVVAGKKTLKSVVPFGPFLILGSLISLVWGGVILHWYLYLL